MKFGVAVQQQQLAGRRRPMPAGGVAREHHHVVGEQHGLHRLRYAGGPLPIQAARAGGGITHGVEHVGISHPIEQAVRPGVRPALVARAGHDGGSEAVMVERSVGLIEEAALGGAQVLVGSSGPDEPFHPIERDVGGGPEKPIFVVGEVEIHGDAALAELGEALGILRAQFGTAQRRQQHRGEDGDDRDDDQEFDQAERASRRSVASGAGTGRGNQNHIAGDAGKLDLIQAQRCESSVRANDQSMQTATSDASGVILTEFPSARFVTIREIPVWR